MSSIAAGINAAGARRVRGGDVAGAAEASGREARARLRWCVRATVLCAIWCAGCGPDSTPPAPQAAKPAAGPGAVPALPAAQPAPAAAGEAQGPDNQPVRPRPIIGRTTQDVRDATTEIAAGAKKVEPKVTGQDPITVSASAYVSIIGQAQIAQIKHTVDLFHALHGRYPKDFAEFHKEVIKANGIRLAALPAYLEYGYDADKHELVILEYPDRKAALLGEK